MAFFALGLFGFLLLGALQAAYGPAFDALGARFGVGRADIGLIASAHFLGSMLGLGGGGALLGRLGLRRLLRLGAGLMALGLGGVTFAPFWNLALVGALLAGFGFGNISVTFNVGGARLGPAAPRVLNLLNACFGLGSILAPFLVTLLGGGVIPFALLGIAALALLLLCGQMPELPETAPPRGGTAPARLLALFGLLFALYVGVEAGVGSWMTAQLADRGYVNAAAWTGGFWLALTLGRLLAARFASPAHLPTLVIGAALVAALSLLLAGTPFAPLAYLLTGLAIAPIFAASLSWFGQLLPTRLAPVVMACGGLGGTLFPWLLGRLAGAYGTGALPGAFSLTALGVVGAALIVQAAVRRTVLARA